MNKYRQPLSYMCPKAKRRYDFMTGLPFMLMPIVFYIVLWFSL